MFFFFSADKFEGEVMRQPSIWNIYFYPWKIKRVCWNCLSSQLPYCREKAVVVSWLDENKFSRKKNYLKNHPRKDLSITLYNMKIGKKNHFSEILIATVHVIYPSPNQWGLKRKAIGEKKERSEKEVKNWRKEKEQK